MRAASMVVSYPRFQNPSQMSLVQRDQIIQALPSHGADQPFAVSLRLGCSEWRLQNAHAHRLHGSIKLHGVDPVSVVEDKPIQLFTTKRFTELLQGPLCCGLLRDVEVSDAACPYFHHHEDVEDPESCADGDKEIAGQDGLGMIAHEGHPTLRRGPTP